MLIFSGAGYTETSEETPFGEAQTVEEFVREYFGDIPVMAEVARCESTFRHFGENGNILRGIVNRSDVGVMQVNEYYHGDTAEVLNLDLYTLEGNVAYSRFLYEREGTTPWEASRTCWDNQHIAMR